MKESYLEGNMLGNTKYIGKIKHGDTVYTNIYPRTRCTPISTLGHGVHQYLP